VLATDGILDPVFSSIEEWLGNNIQAYYDVLAEVGQGKWNPANDARPWVQFCLKAHYQQAARMIRRVQEADSLYKKIEEMIAQSKLQDRMWFPLFDAALGFRVTNSRYRKDAEITEITASRDLKRLCELGLLIPHGERKMRTYTAAPVLKQARDSIRV